MGVIILRECKIQSGLLRDFVEKWQQVKCMVAIISFVFSKATWFKGSFEGECYFFNFVEKKWKFEEDRLQYVPKFRNFLKIE